jgi:hypothetical protein
MRKTGLGHDRIDIPAVDAQRLPVVAEANGGAKYVTMFAISAGSMSFCSSDCGRCLRMNSRCASSHGSHLSTS